MPIPVKLSNFAKLVQNTPFSCLVRQQLRVMGGYVAIEVWCRSLLSKKSQKIIASPKMPLIFASETTKTGPPVEMEITKNKNNNKKDTIMKTMVLTQATVAQFEESTMTTKVNNFKKAAKKFFKAVYRILIVTSPVYPQYVESLQRKS